MDGVRRWMSAHPASAAAPSRNSRRTQIDQQESTDKEPELNPFSTETIASQHLDPSVSVEEEEEYQG